MSTHCVKAQRMAAQYIAVPGADIGRRWGGNTVHVVVGEEGERGSYRRGGRFIACVYKPEQK